jgi:hypothetical protein
MPWSLGNPAMTRSAVSLRAAFANLRLVSEKSGMRPADPVKLISSVAARHGG